MNFSSELIQWFLMITIIVSSIGFGLSVGFGLGRKSMLEEIYQRRVVKHRFGIFRRAKERLFSAIAAVGAGDVLDAEVLD